MYAQCLAMGYRWCHHHPRGGVGKRIDAKIKTKKPVTRMESSWIILEEIVQNITSDIQVKIVGLTHKYDVDIRESLWT